MAAAQPCELKLLCGVHCSVGCVIEHWCGGHVPRMYLQKRSWQSKENQRKLGSWFRRFTSCMLGYQTLQDSANWKALFSRSHALTCACGMPRRLSSHILWPAAGLAPTPPPCSLLLMSTTVCSLGCCWLTSGRMETWTKSCLVARSMPLA